MPYMQVPDIEMGVNEESNTSETSLLLDRPDAHPRRPSYLAMSIATIITWIAFNTSALYVCADVIQGKSELYLVCIILSP